MGTDIVVNDLILIISIVGLIAAGIIGIEIHIHNSKIDKEAAAKNIKSDNKNNRLFGK